MRLDSRLSAIVYFERPIGEKGNVSTMSYLSFGKSQQYQGASLLDFFFMILLHLVEGLILVVLYISDGYMGYRTKCHGTKVQTQNMLLSSVNVSK